MFEETKYDRRRFIGTTAMTIAAAQLGMMGLAKAQPRKTKPSNVSTIQPHKHIIWPCPADRCWSAECWIRRGRRCQWPSCNSSARLAL